MNQMTKEREDPNLKRIDERGRHEPEARSRSRTASGPSAGRPTKLVPEKHSLEQCVDFCGYTASKRRVILIIYALGSRRRGNRNPLMPSN